MDRVRLARVAAALVALAPAGARAEHDHSPPARPTDPPAATASIGAVAASYRTRLYRGHYEGVMFGALARLGRVEVGARGAMYQIDRNGRSYRGFGDLMLHGAVTIVEREALAAGAHLMAMVPVGDEREGYGMGHWMLMPAGWVTWTHPAVVVAGSLGYARAIGGRGEHADHGTWPLVDPMTRSELTFDATALIVLADALRAGGRVLGAIATGGEDARTIAGARVTWRAGRIETTGEAQVGVTGDPVRMRGLLAIAVAF